MAKNKTFSIKFGALDKSLETLFKVDSELNKALRAPMEAAVDIVFRTATAKRPMITNQQAKAEGRRKVRVTSKSGKVRYVYKRVSDPNAAAGVPVDTGALRASINKSITREKSGNLVGRIYTDLDYALPVEFGHKVKGSNTMVPPRPFMRPALQLNIEYIRNLFRGMGGKDK